MSYISDYKASGDYEEYKINATMENNMERYFETHFPDYDPNDYVDGDEVQEEEE